MTEEREMGICDTIRHGPVMHIALGVRHTETPDCVNWREQTGEALGCPQEFLDWWNTNWPNLAPTHQALRAWLAGRGEPVQGEPPMTKALDVCERDFGPRVSEGISAEQFWRQENDGEPDPEVV